MGAPGEDDQPGLTIQLVRIVDALPEGFAALRAEADAQGHNNLARLEVEFAETPEMFTALLAALGGGELLGIGGLTAEPTDPSAQRMRRLYVAQRGRGQGVGRTLANALLNEALGVTRLVNVYAADADAARFWEAMGFEPVQGQAWSHRFFAG